MTTYVSINGKICAPRDACVSVFDRGFLYGDSVFETVRTYGGVPFSLPEHLTRLEGSAAKVFIELPVSKEQLTREIEEVLQLAGNPESYIRIVVTRGEGAMGLDPSAALGPTRVVIVSELTTPPAATYQQGISTITWKVQRSTDVAGAQGAKIGNYLVSVLAMRKASESGAQEALIVDADDRILEGASSNFFVVRDGAVLTAPVEAGILAGITRSVLLEACQSLHIPVTLEAPRLAEVWSAQEAFISSSIREMLPVVRVDGRPVGVGAPGPITRSLLAEFRRSVRSRH